MEIFLPPAAAEVAARRAASTEIARPALQVGAGIGAGAASRVRRQLREHAVSAMFLAKVCSEDAPRRKPHPAPLRMALEKLRALPQTCVYIGDAPEDIEMAHRAGVRAIGVLGGSPVPGEAACRPQTR